MELSLTKTKNLIVLLLAFVFCLPAFADGYTFTGGGGGGSGTVNSGTANQTAYYATTGTAVSGAGPGTAGQVWTSNGAGSAPTFQTVTGTGTVTSVALSLPANSFFTVSGSPITGAGTLTATPAATAGDFPYASATNTISNLAIGPLYTNLTVSGSSLPVYSYGLNGEQEPTAGATLTATSPSIVDYNTGGGGGTYILPVSTTCLGKWFVFNKFALGNFTVQTQGGDVFVGDASLSSNTGGRYAAYLSNGNGTWISISPTVQQLAQGGTGANITAVAGGAIYSTSTGMAVTAAGNSGAPLLSGGAGAAAFGALNLAGGSNIVSGVLPVANGGTGSATGLGILAVRVVTAAGAVTVTTADGVVVINKTSGAATTVNLPASPATGLEFIIKDGKGDANTNNITVVPAAGNIDGAANFVMNTNYYSANFVYNGTQWNVF